MEQKSIRENTILYGTQFEKDISFQGEFPETLWCECKGKMYPIIQVADDLGEICNHRPDDANLWMHDSAVIVVYQCTDCMELKSMYEQG